MHLLLQKDSEINQGYSTMEGLCWVCCMSHQMMGLKSRRGEGPTVTTSKNAAVPHHSHLQLAKSAGGASPVVPTDLDASSSICPTEGKGLTASRKVFLSPASFSPAQPTPRVLRLKRPDTTNGLPASPCPQIFLHSRQGGSRLRPTAHRQGGNYCLNSGIS